MLLEFGLEIDANSDFTEITNFVDRSGVVHPDPGGGISYTPPDAGSGIAYSPSIGDQRDKWEIDYVVKVVPGKTLLETPEEFLYWRAKNQGTTSLSQWKPSLRISVARVPSGVCSQACACEVDIGQMTNLQGRCLRISGWRSSKSEAGFSGF